MIIPSQRNQFRTVPHGFTIIELITAMFIFGMVVATIFSTYTAVINGSVAAN